MRAVVTRVSSASVDIAGKTVGEIGRGFLVLLGIAPTDTEAQADKRSHEDQDRCRLDAVAEQDHAPSESQQEVDEIAEGVEVGTT